MFKLFNGWNSETTVKTENLSRKISKAGNVFAMLIIAMFIFSACENEVNVTLVTGSSVSKYYVHNGESVTLTVTLAEGAIDEVSFFWDSEKIQTFTAPPYEVTYNVENESIGIHSFSYRAICSRHKGGAAASASTSGAHAIVVEE